MNRTAVPLLQVEDLNVSFSRGAIHAVRDVSFHINRGETLGLVGESGSGKSLTSLAILGLLEHSRAAVTGSVRMNFGTGDDIEVLRARPRELRRLRGAKVAMIFQDPMTSLNPVMRVGDQIAEAILLHRRMDAVDVRARAVELLDIVGIPEPEERARAYPHHLSGGMCQRVGIAMALACQPELLIADEPTTALDVTIQAQILETIRNIQRRFGMSMLFISHDLGVVAEVADRTAVMYAGRIVETGPAADVLHDPAHPYTRGLIRSIPDIELGRDRPIVPIPGAMPDPTAMPVGCPFHPRCDWCKSGLCDQPGAAAGFVTLSTDRAARCERLASGIAA